MASATCGEPVSWRRCNVKARDAAAAETVESSFDAAPRWWRGLSLRQSRPRRLRAHAQKKKLLSFGNRARDRAIANQSQARQSNAEAKRARWQAAHLRASWPPAGPSAPQPPTRLRAAARPGPCRHPDPSPAQHSRKFCQSLTLAETSTGARQECSTGERVRSSSWPFAMIAMWLRVWCCGGGAHEVIIAVGCLLHRGGAAAALVKPTLLLLLRCKHHSHA